MNRSSPAILVFAFAIAVIGFGACTDHQDITGKSPDGTLSIRSEHDTTAEVDTLTLGDLNWLSVRSVDTSATVAWSIADTTVLQIVEQWNGRVRVRALRVGSTTVTAQHEGQTGTIRIVVREMNAADTIPRVEITLVLDSLLVGDSLGFGFNIFNRRWEYFNNRPFTITLSDSTVIKLVPMGQYPRSFWIVGMKVGHTVIKVDCACIPDSMTIHVREPVPAAPDPRAARWQPIDLGTLGGGTSVPLAINDNGDVVGYSTTADGKQHAFLWSNGVMRDLAPSSDRSAAYVVTNSRSAAGTDVVNGEVHVVRWDDGQMTDLGAVTSGDHDAAVVCMTSTALVARGETGSAIWQDGVKQFLAGFRALAVNSRHQIVGNIADRPYVWDNGTLQALEIAGVPSHAVDINSDGVILGDTPGPTSWGTQLLIARWYQGRLAQSYSWSQPIAINDSGEAIAGLYGSGTFYTAAGDPWQIGSLGQGVILPHDLNNQGLVVGYGWTLAKAQHAFVWHVPDDRAIDLGTGPSADDRTGSNAVAINARGDIVGWVAPCTTPSGRCTELDQTRARAVLWKLTNP